MAISGWSGIPYGCVFQSNIAGHPSVSEIHGDGRVDPSFDRPDDPDFIDTIDDPRVRDFAMTGTPPEEEWVQVEEGHWKHGHQQLLTQRGSVTLKSWIEENGKLVTHHIEAPFHWTSGKIDVRTSTEGFRISPLPPPPPPVHREINK